MRVEYLLGVVLCVLLVLMLVRTVPVLYGGPVGLVVLIVLLLVLFRA